MTFTSALVQELEHAIRPRPPKDGKLARLGAHFTQHLSVDRRQLLVIDLLGGDIGLAAWHLNIDQQQKVLIDDQRAVTGKVNMPWPGS